MTTSQPPAWTAVIPVKEWARAKTRLEVPEGARAAFARAVALDTVDTVAASKMIDRILVVSDQPGLADDVAACAGRVVVVYQRRWDTFDRLNDAIRLARDWAITNASTFPVVVIPADLPALTTASLEQALLQLAWFDRSHVPDHRGDGTTLCAAVEPALLDPRYGPASERAHSAAGSVAVIDVPFDVRLDVDTLDDLPGAVALGLGQRARGIDLRTQLEFQDAVAADSAATRSTSD